MEFETRKFLSLCVCLLLSFFSANVYAADLSNLELSGGFGLAKLHVGNSAFAVTDTETDSLVQTANPIVGDVNFGVAYVWPLNSMRLDQRVSWFPSVKTGLNLRYFDQNVQGQIYQYQEPDLDNYTYNLSVESTRLMFDISLTLATVQRFSLFLQGGAGAGWTQTSYSDMPNEGIPSGSLSINNRTNSGFVSEVGGGISYDIQENFGISLQYLYANYGTIKTSSTATLNGDPASIAPAQFPLRSQEVLFNVYMKM
jgi:opacity protein-like surface antigen